MRRSVEFEDAVDRWLQWRKIPFMRVSNYRCFACGQVQNAKATGAPDFLTFPEGGPITAVECKTGKGVLSAVQKAFKANMEASGGRWITVHDTVDQLEKWNKENK